MRVGILASDHRRSISLRSTFFSRYQLDQAQLASESHLMGLLSSIRSKRLLTFNILRLYYFLQFFAPFLSALFALALRLIRFSNKNSPSPRNIP